MLVNGKHYRTVWMENKTVKMIEQNKLPFSFEIHECRNHKETANAIRDMIIRGAPAIGAAGAFAMAQAFSESRDTNYIKKAKATIEATRLTARDLFYAINRVFNATNPAAEARMIADESSDACKRIGEIGEKLIKDGFRILTHCNAGWLACVDYGTALSPIYMAKRNSKKIFVFADETRPRSQGARLTAWELKNERIEHAIIVDNAAAHFMQRGKIDLIIVGADRIAINGDIANKIGTLEKAIVAKEFGIPFYVAAPLSTIDIKYKSGKDIPIEERGEDEILYQTGLDENGKIRKILVCNPGSSSRNPAFDITPAKYIKGIITEKGIIKPSRTEITRLFKR